MTQEWSLTVSLLGLNVLHSPPTFLGHLSSLPQKSKIVLIRRIPIMDAITGFAGKLFMKQKMGSVTQSIPGMSKEEDDSPAKSTRDIKKGIAANRAERDAEYERKKESRASKKSSISERWAANKSQNSLT